ncbi:MAG TPA: sulfatase-like hydrolase/transferase [Thermoanaerobaculia bacterium]|nr:sulfatase-like hydrolase/transferase [Thermoanaerobaculia bacterium]
MIRTLTLATTLLVAAACARESAPPHRETAGRPHPSILLVTLDTTRADAIGPEAKGITTPAFDRLAQNGLRFRHAYATVPETLPSHVSMMTGLYPAAHGVHDNARYLAPEHSLVAEKLKAAGYTTAAFVSGYPLQRSFGLARGFDVYDDEFAATRNERSAAETTERALAWLGQPNDGPLFVWVHYFDPHHPYEPPEPFRTPHAKTPYLGEVAAMDAEMGRLIDAFRARRRDAAIIVAGDHGEALGEHGEAQHGHLLYEGVMRVPLAMAGPGVRAGVIDTPVSTRRIFHTILDWAGLGGENSLRHPMPEVVLGEAMKPFLYYGWQPQVMAVDGRWKTIRAGRIEVYDIVADPAESRDLAAQAPLSRAVRQSLLDYPLPAEGETKAAAVTDEDRRRLASLGYITSETKPVIRAGAPRPRDMIHLFDLLDRASQHFAAGDFPRAIPLLERILEADPYNLMAALRLAAAHSALRNDRQAMAAFERARTIAPESADVQHYLAVHLLSRGAWERAAPLLESVLAKNPGRLPTMEALATVREKQGRYSEAVELLQRVIAAGAPSGEQLVRLGSLAMEAGNTAVAIDAFERARAVLGGKFRNDLELGVLYLAARRFDDARAALDRVPPDHPAWAMALFKRAQVSVLLRESDRRERIERARRHADSTTRDLIARERLFQR